ncbi:MAG: NAD(P)/FAD-dependent oxidoreductase [Candidatus Thorarchaeota archaeon]
MDRDFATFDICIIGASIAGNYLCYLLSKTNLKIIVIEEHTEIGLPFQCAGIVSQKLTKLIDIPNELILNHVNTAKIVSSSGEFIKLSGQERPYVINRVGLDNFFYDKLKNRKNISFLLGEKFKSFKYVKLNHQKYVLVKTSRRKITAKMLIGSDGPLSTVGRILGIKNKILYAVQYRIESQFDDDEAVMFFDERWKELFAWIVPEGKNVYRIGMASSKNIVDNFRIFLKKFKLNQEKKIDQQGGLIPYGIMNKMAFDNVLLLGDSAGQVKATTGGGIIMLLTAAKYAAYCIKKCFKNNNFSAKSIRKYYQNQCNITIGKELKIHFIIRAFLENMTDKDFKNVFKIIKFSKIENLISIYGDMDFPRSLLFKLIKNPLFVFFIIKCLIKNPQLITKIFRLL